MGFFTILMIAIGLALDAGAVTLGARASGRSRGMRAALRLAFHFGLFQALMPLIGWYAGRAVVSLIAAFDHWIAFGLLLLVGGQMIRSGLNKDEKKTPGDPSRKWTLVILSVATSIDALAVGLTLGVLRVEIWLTVTAIGAVTMFISLIAFWLGARLDALAGKRMEIVGGLVLWLVGLRILVEHLR